MDTAEFIERSGEIHGRYDYSLTIFKSYKEKIQIICPEHGVFEQTPNNHLYGKKGCKFCANNQKYCTKKILSEFKKVHDNKYDYSLVNYDGMFKGVKIICSEHGEFEQTSKNHLSGKGCPKCAGKNKTTAEAIKEFIDVHGNRYDYSLVKYGFAKEKVKIICPKHGTFNQSPNDHKSGKGCRKCNMSKGEQKIREFLKKSEIKFDYQKTFDGCVNTKTGKLLIFDFYLKDYNICIEYDGEQHFLPMRFSSGNNVMNLKEIQNRDLIKTNFCKKDGIKLLRIKYTKLKEIDDILNETFGSIYF